MKLLLLYRIPRYKRFEDSKGNVGAPNEVTTYGHTYFNRKKIPVKDCFVCSNSLHDYNNKNELDYNFLIWTYTLWGEVKALWCYNIHSHFIASIFLWIEITTINRKVRRDVINFWTDNSITKYILKNPQFFFIIFHSKNVLWKKNKILRNNRMNFLENSWLCIEQWNFKNTKYPLV